MADPNPSERFNPNATPLDKSFYTWTNTFKGMLGLLSPTEVQKYNDVHTAIKQDVYCRTCEERKEWALNYSTRCAGSPYLSYMLCETKSPCNRSDSQIFKGAVRGAGRRSERDEYKM
jgi:hypothetical protein